MFLCYAQTVFLSCRPNCVPPPPPHPQASVVPPTVGSKGGDALVCGGGGPYSDDGQTLWYSELEFLKNLWGLGIEE
jgi:hypothetical protein